MTYEEAMKAFKTQVRVVHDCLSVRELIVYKRIRAFKYEVRPNGTMFVSLGLTDDKERCLVWAEPSSVAVYDPNLPLNKDLYFLNRPTLSV